jgi:hypothetical protein
METHVHMDTMPPTETQPPMETQLAVETQPEASRAYARRVYDRIIAWDEVANRRAQLILTLNGVFVSFLVGSTLSKSAELSAVTNNFGPETWVCLAAMTVTLVLSIGFAIGCYVSQFNDLRSASGGQESTSDIVPWYFPVVADVGETNFMASVEGVDAASEAKTLAVNAVRAARYLVRKYYWVNLGFVCAAGTLVLFLLAGVSYVLRVA